MSAEQVKLLQVGQKCMGTVGKAEIQDACEDTKSTQHQR